MYFIFIECECVCVCGGGGGGGGIVTDNIFCSSVMTIYRLRFSKTYCFTSSWKAWPSRWCLMFQWCHTPSRMLEWNSKGFGGWPFNFAIKRSNHIYPRKNFMVCPGKTIMVDYHNCSGHSQFIYLCQQVLGLWSFCFFLLWKNQWASNAYKL